MKGYAKIVLKYCLVAHLLSMVKIPISKENKDPSARDWKLLYVVDAMSFPSRIKPIALSPSWYSPNPKMPKLAHSHNSLCASQIIKEPRQPQKQNPLIPNRKKYPLILSPILIRQKNQPLIQIAIWPLNCRLISS